MHHLSLVVCLIAILASSKYQVADEAETKSEPARCVYRVSAGEVYDLTSLANTNGTPRFAYIIHTLT